MTINNSKTITNIIRVSLLRNIFLVCLIIAIAFPFYSVFFVYPSFIDLLIKSTEDDAISTATHLTRMIIPEETELKNNALSKGLMTEIEQMAKDFHLESLKIFIKTGEIIYSTNEKDIGRINNEEYFHNVVAKGNVYTNVVRKDTTSLEGRVVQSDVVETYVPLARNRKFNGAFEIYYDITDKKQKLDDLLSQSSYILYLIAVSLLFAIMIILFKASKTMIERSHAEEALRQAHMELERRVQERTRELAEANEALHLLSSHLLTAQERERRRISLELHDELGQSLTVLKLQLRSMICNLQENEEARQESCENTLTYVDQIIENVRRLSRDLSPSILEDLGLTAALKWLIEDFAKHSGIDISLTLPNIDNLFSSDSQIIIYRIFQEALSNIGKHAQASKAAVTIEKGEGSIFFLIEDDGKGFDMKQVESRYPTEKSLGLVAMDERARMLGCILHVDSQMNKGTRLSFKTPIGKQREGE